MKNTGTIDHSQYLITCTAEEGCTMRFFHLPEHEAANHPRLCGDHLAARKRYQEGLQGHPHWSVD